MIDIDKVRAAFAATPITNRTWIGAEHGRHAIKEGEPMCPAAALIHFAGKTRAEIRDGLRQHNARFLYDSWASRLLESEYGIGPEVGVRIPHVADMDQYGKTRRSDQAAGAVIQFFENVNAGVPEPLRGISQHIPLWGTVPLMPHPMLTTTVMPHPMLTTTGEPKVEQFGTPVSVEKTPTSNGYKHRFMYLNGTVVEVEFTPTTDLTWTTYEDGYSYYAASYAGSKLAVISNI
jgi:hypothetical protein